MKGNSGSILFIVLLVMTVLIVLASAAYYTVNANRSELVTEYTDTQTYTSATAISKMVSSALQGETTDATKNSFTDLQDLVSNLTNEGDFVMATGTTPINGMFEEYTVKITYDGTEGANAHYTLETTVLYNGKEVKTTEILDSTIVQIPSSISFDRFFTATGLCSGEVYLGVSEVTSNVYLDNAMTYFKQGYGAKTAFYADLVCAGSVSMSYFYVPDSVSTPLTWTVGNNYYLDNASDDVKLHDGALYVGKDLFVTKSARSFGSAYQDGKKTDVYIIGDLYPLAQASFNGDLYVGGTIQSSLAAGVDSVLTAGGNMDQNGFNINGKLYLTAEEMARKNVTEGAKSIKIGAKTISVNKGIYLWTPEEVNNTNDLINTTLGSYTYQTLALKDEQVSKQISIDLTKIGVQDGYTNTLSADRSILYVTVNQSCTITNFTGYTGTNAGDNQAVSNKTVVVQFDTTKGTALSGTDSEGNPISIKTMYIRLMPNRADKTSFAWKGDNNTSNSKDMVVLATGGGSVIMEMGQYTLANGTKGITSYQGSMKEYVGTEEVYQKVKSNWGNGTSLYNALLDAELNCTVNNNVYLVSKTKDTTGISMQSMDNNCFCGYIYAPYLRYSDSQSNEYVAMFGGMIVSSYNISNNRRYICAKPDQDMVSLILGSLIQEDVVFETDRSWRRIGGNA